MAHLTDIRTPNYYNRAPQPPKDGFFKRFFRALLAIILAPIIWPWRASIWLVREAKNMLLTIVLGAKNLLFRLTPNNWAGWLVLLLAFGLLFQFAVTANVFSFFNFPKVEADKLQAVFLQNGQVYFGHLKKAGGDYAVLENVYYLKTQTGGQTAANLVKLGNELHGPEDAMFIPNNQIAFWENLRSDSQVTKAINQAGK